MILEVSGELQEAPGGMKTIWGVIVGPLGAIGTVRALGYLWDESLLVWFWIFDLRQRIRV